jgi:hypothetical protein
MKSEKQKIIVALIVFVITFIVFSWIFSNWNFIKDLLF